MNKFLIKAALLAAGGLFLAAPAHAQTATTGDIAVSLTVTAECTIATSDSLAFGTTGGLFTAELEATADLNVTCNGNTPYSIAVSGGGSTDVDARELTGPGAATIPYELTSDPEHTENWGVTEGTDTVDGTADATGTPETHTIYGVVRAGGNAPTGDYTDTVVATISYGIAP